MRTIFLIIILFLLQSCSNNIHIIKDNSAKTIIPSDIKQVFQFKTNQSLLIFTELYFNENLKISQEHTEIIVENIITDEIVGVAKSIKIKPRNTTIEFLDRNFSFKLKRKDIEKYNYIYVSCDPRIDTAMSLGVKDMLKANYLIEFTNDIRYFR